MKEEKQLTGYPSIDKPWLKYYSEEAIGYKLPTQSMYQLMIDKHKTREDDIAIVYFDKNIKYKDMFLDIDLIANSLINHGIKQGDIVVIVSLNTPETIALIYALNKIGAIADMIPVNSNAKEILSEVHEVNAKIIFILDKILDSLNEYISNVEVVLLPIGKSVRGFKGIILRKSIKKTKYLKFDNFVNTKISQDIIVNDINGDTPAIILHTSGTTGSPKRAVLTNGNVNAVVIQLMNSGKNYTTKDNLLNILPPFISFGIGMLHLCMVSNMKMTILLLPDKKTVSKAFNKYKPTRFVFGPAILDILMKSPNKNLSHLIDITGGGASISKEDEEMLNEILTQKHSGSPYLSGYGMTELSSAAATNHITVHKSQSAGILLPLMNAKIIDVESGKELKYNEEGELLICGPTLMKEYLNNKQETEKAIETDNEGNRWLHTGDLALIDTDGFIFITGRIKRIYTTIANNNVLKIFPKRLEDFIGSIEGILMCAVICVPSPTRQNVPVVYMTIKKEIKKEKIVNDVENIIKKELPDYYFPEKIVVIDSMPITSSQKIDYRALEKQAEEMR